MGFGTAERANIAARTGQRDLERRIVELGIVSEQHDEAIAVELALQGLVGPGHDQLVGMGEALGGGEGAARIHDDDAEAKRLGECHERDGDMYRADDVHGRRWWEGLDEDLYIT